MKVAVAVILLFAVCQVIYAQRGDRYAVSNERRAFGSNAERSQSDAQTIFEENRSGEEEATEQEPTLAEYEDEGDDQWENNILGEEETQDPTTYEDEFTFMKEHD